MDEQDPLIELFIERHPRAAAAALGGVSITDAGAFIDAVHPGHATALISNMPIGSAAACLQTLPTDRAAFHLGNLNTRLSAALLRLMEQDKRNEFLAELPAATRIQIELVLRQPTHRVGAWIETRVLTALSGVTVEEFRRSINDSQLTDGDIYLVDEEGRLQGAVPPTRLLALKPKSPVDLAARTSHSVLRANATIESALNDPAWEVMDILPVVDRQGKLVGSIRQTVLRRVMSQEAEMRPTVGSGEYMNLADTVYVGLAEVLATSFSRPRQAEEGPRRSRSSQR